MGENGSKKEITFWLSCKFAMGSLGVGLLFSLANTYFIYFVTDIALVPSAIMGTVFLVTRILDLCCTPIIAGFMQNTRAKCGKYRAWILYIIPITSIFVILCFTKITGNSIIVAIYYGVMYLLAYGLMDKPGGAQKALMTRMASNDNERMMLASRTAQFENLGNVIFAAVALPLVAFLGNGDEGKGFFRVAILFSIIGFISYYMTASAGKDYDEYENVKEQKKNTIPAKELVQVITKNKPLVLSMLIEACRYLGHMIFVSTMAYYFKYVIGDMGAITMVSTLGTIVCLVGTMIAPSVSKRIGRKNTSVLAMGLYSFGLLAPRFILTDNLTFFTVCVCLLYLGLAFQTCVGIVLYSKAADYYENKTGIKAHGFIMSVYVWPVEIGIALSVPVVGWLLNAIGYVPDAVLSATQLVGLKNLVLLVPGLLCIIGMILAAIHPLNEKKMKEIDCELGKKKDH